MRRIWDHLPVNQKIPESQKHQPILITNSWLNYNWKQPSFPDSIHCPCPSKKYSPGFSKKTPLKPTRNPPKFHQPGARPHTRWVASPVPRFLGCFGSFIKGRPWADPCKMELWQPSPPPKKWSYTNIIWKKGVIVSLSGVLTTPFRTTRGAHLVTNGNRQK